MKNFFLLILPFFCVNIFSQVGVNIANPKGVFHVDGSKDNPSTGMPSALQEQNDFIITSSGDVGVGTINPTSKLHTQSNKNYGAFQMQDGSEGNGKVLTSDSMGKTTWITNVAITPISFGVLNGNTQVVASNMCLGHKITLKQGKWLIYIGQLLNSKSPGTMNNNMWVRLTLSSNASSINKTGFDFIASSFASGWLGPARSVASDAYSFISGVMPVNVKDSSVTLYVWIGNIEKVGTPPSTTITNNGENYLFAVPAA